jgi:predicted metal-dependent phosphoesterase TrpH
MPKRQAFTELCRLTASQRPVGRADLHIHTTFSDGDYSPAEVVDLAVRSGLAAIAITDHDTLGAIAPARAAADGRLEIVPGVEISGEHAGQGRHLLGYFVCLSDRALNGALAALQSRRAGRFAAMVERLRQHGVRLDASDLPAPMAGTALGRRHLAACLVRTRRARTLGEAFHRYLGNDTAASVPKVYLALAEAIPLVRGAGGVAALAHPSYDCTRDELAVLRDIGLGAVEVDFRGCRATRARELRHWAGELGLAVTGGSDCHGPGRARADLGGRGVSSQELECLRALASG